MKSWGPEFLFFDITNLCMLPLIISFRDMIFVRRNILRKRNGSVRILLVLTLICCFCLFAGAKKKVTESPIALDSSILENLEWRCIGPANMGGRIDDFAVVESNPSIIYTGTASGGVWKTVNNGVTWKPIFDDQETSTIGDVTVSASHPDVVWVGTGEPNNRQSSSWGNGVYKSTDGGRTWSNVGLKDTHHIGRIAIHPADPDIVYVAALGHLWGPNKERGLYKTEDGGKSWKNTLFINENTGCVDVAMDPENADTLYAAAYQRSRRGWGFIGGGPYSGLYKTTDGGENWTKLTNGLPEGDTGRIGIDIYRKDSSVVYVVLENKKGGVFRSEDKGFSWKKMSSTNPRPMYYSKIRIDPDNDQRIWVLGAQMFVSDDGGKTFKTDRVTRVHGDHHAMWINPSDSNHMVLGSDGGIYFSYDRGKTWDFVNSLPIGQFYEIGLDTRDPYWVYGGLQDNGSWGGPSGTRFRQGITNDEWIKIGGGDGFYTQVDPTDPNTIYIESQNGFLSRLDLKTGESRFIRPEPKNPDETFRFNWNCPILISPHDPQTIYYGGNKLFISNDRGENWEETEDLTKQKDREKMPLMGLLPDKNTLSKHDGIESYGNIITIAESSKKKGLLYVGTDDGNLQVSHDGGETWENVAENVPGVPELTYVSRVVASQHAVGRAYVTFDGHRNNDFKPYVFMTSDHGSTWKSISNNLPEGGTVNVIREHHKNPDLLFVGTERGAYFSLDRGMSWVRIEGNFPVVPVDDIALHPRKNDLVLGTHGRSIWILDDITPLEQLTKADLASPFLLSDIKPAAMVKRISHKGNLGHKIFVAPNPPFGAVINYYLKGEAKKVQITIKDLEEKKVRTLEGTKKPGVNRVIWDLRYGPPEMPDEGERNRYYRVLGPFVLPGEYMVVLDVDSHEAAKNVQVSGDPRITVSFEERKAQHDLLMKIHSLMPRLTNSVKTLAKLKTQINGVHTKLKKIPDIDKSLLEKTNALKEEIADIRIKILGDRKLGWRAMLKALRGSLTMISNRISGFTGAPTKEQIISVEKKETELQEYVDRINQIIEVEFQNLNKLLNENNITHLMPVDKIK